mmetsp:Transcript_15628/g.38991  ORF Transcript_15628/g.38991 Transcript_15628/m.38991 type:complete len:349 (+) Transcript_15628:267-1313(+)
MMRVQLQFVLSLVLIFHYQLIDGLILSRNLYIRHSTSFSCERNGEGGILQRQLSLETLLMRRHGHHQQHSLFSTSIDSTDNDDKDEIEKSTTDDYEYQRHAQFMTMALKEAERAKQAGEVPIGALVVQSIIKDEDDDESNQGDINADNSESKHQSLTQQFDNTSSFRILSLAGNSVERNHDASAHAELLALRDAARVLKNWRLHKCILYSTLEPCPMCLAAAQAFRIEQIVYGAPDMRLGAHTTFMKLLDDYQHPYHTIRSVVPGVLDDKSAGMLRDFFRSRRKEQKLKRKLEQSGEQQSRENKSIRPGLRTMIRSKRSIVRKKLGTLPLSLWKRLKRMITKIVKRRK